MYFESESSFTGRLMCIVFHSEIYGVFIFCCDFFSFHRRFLSLCSSPCTTFSTPHNPSWLWVFSIRMWMKRTLSNILDCTHPDFHLHFSTKENSSKAPYRDLSPVVYFFFLVTVSHLSSTHSVWKSSQKCLIFKFLILAFVTNFVPFKTDQSGNTVWA